MGKENFQSSMETIIKRIRSENVKFDGEERKENCEKMEGFLEGLQSDGLWSDIVYDCENLRFWRASEHLRRLRIMATSWSRDKSAFGSEKLLAAILKGIEGWCRRNPLSANWWWNDIGVPMELGICLIHICASSENDVLTRVLPIFERFLPASRFTGQNLAWVACIRIRHGLLLRDSSIVSEGFVWLGEELKVTDKGEGIQPDMSFFQHGPLLYSGGYGAGFICDVSEVVALAEGTTYSWSQEKIKLLSELILDAARWMVRGGTFDYGSIGREITREGHDASRFYRACEYMSSVVGPYSDEFQSVVESGSSGSHVIGNKHFCCADLMTHHRSAFYASVRLASNRLLGADMPCCGGEGRLSHHMAEGATFFLKSGDEYRDIFPVWDWQQIPGTTTEQLPSGLDPEVGLRRFGETSFAGGASDGKVGCAAMDFRRNNLSARKSYFFFDNSVLCMGAGISCDSGNPVRTTIEQCRLEGTVAVINADKAKQVIPPGEYRIPVGGQVIHNGIAYHILSDDALLSTSNQSGRWCDCGVGSDELVTLPVFKLGIECDSPIENDSYSYLVEPSAGEVIGDGDVSMVSIVSNEPNLQAVWHSGMRLGMAVFYEPGSVMIQKNLLVSVDRTCILLMRCSKTDELIFTVAQPAQETGSLRISVTGATSFITTVSLPADRLAGGSITFLAKKNGDTN